MRIHGHMSCEATDAVHLRDRPDLDLVVFRTGDAFDEVHFRGTPAERGDFLRRLAEEADALADQIDSPGEAAW